MDEVEAHQIDGLRRPGPESRRVWPGSRLGLWWREWRERTVDRSWGSARHPTAELGSVRRGRGLAIVGVVALVVAGVWGSLAFRARSSVPVDDRLPFLIEPQPGDAPREPPGEAEVAGAELSETEAAAGSSGESPESQPPGGDGVVAPVSPIPPDAVDEVEPLTDVLVHVSGRVAAPGVVQVPAGSRVVHVIEAAGGASADADLDRLNLAAPVVDGERVHVPALGDASTPELVETIRPPPAQTETIWPPAEPTATPVVVDPNIATVADLQDLPGIGPTIATAIVTLREAQGPYRSIEELLDVPGIGPAKLEQIRPWIEVGTLSTAP